MTAPWSGDVEIVRAALAFDAGTIAERRHTKGHEALARLIERLAEVERERTLAWEVRDAYQAEKEAAEQRVEELREALLAISMADPSNPNPSSSSPAGDIARDALSTSDSGEAEKRA